MDTFTGLSNEELMTVDGGFRGDYIVAGALFACTGIGCMAIALTPGLNVIGAAAIAYAGTWGVSLGAVSTIAGFFC